MADPGADPMLQLNVMALVLGPSTTMAAAGCVEAGLDDDDEAPDLEVPQPHSGQEARDHREAYLLLALDQQQIS